MAMLTQQRHEEILRLLQENGSVSVNELTERLETSESTIRRDLLALDRMGKLHRVHGGATRTERQFLLSEDNIEEKIAKNIDEKRRIAAYAAEQIQPGDFIYLDAGTTTLLVIDYLTIDPSEVTFVTNGIMHGRELSRRGYRVYLLGGELKATTEAIVGIAAAQNLMNYNFSKAFLGTNGISSKFGYSTAYTDEAFLKTAAVDRSFVSYVLADSSKFGKVSTVTFGTLNSSAIITDDLPDQRYLEQTVVKVVGE